MKEIRNISGGCFDGYDCVLITIWSNVDSKKLGDMLADLVDRGGNVVICLFDNTVSYNHCGGRFSECNYNPFKMGGITSSHAAYSIGEHDKNHLLMKGVNTLRHSGDIGRILGSIETGGVKMIARWNDENKSPMIAVRYDKPGMVTSIGFCCSSSRSSGDVIQLLRNAQCLRKKDK